MAQYVNAPSTTGSVETIRSLTINNVKGGKLELGVKELAVVNGVLYSANPLSFISRDLQLDVQSASAFRFKKNAYKNAYKVKTQVGIGDRTYAPDVNVTYLKWNAIQDFGEAVIKGSDEYDIPDVGSWLAQRGYDRLADWTRESIARGFAKISDFAGTHVATSTGTAADKYNQVISEIAKFSLKQDDLQGIQRGGLNTTNTLVYLSRQFWLQILQARLVGDAVSQTFDEFGAYDTARLGGYNAIITDQLPDKTDALIVTSITGVHAAKSIVFNVGQDTQSEDYFHYNTARDINEITYNDTALSARIGTASFGLAFPTTAEASALATAIRRA